MVVVGGDQAHSAGRALFWIGGSMRVACEKRARTHVRAYVQAHGHARALLSRVHSTSHGRLYCRLVEVLERGNRPRSFRVQQRVSESVCHPSRSVASRGLCKRQNTEKDRILGECLRARVSGGFFQSKCSELLFGPRGSQAGWTQKNKRPHSAESNYKVFFVRGALCRKPYAE